MSETLFGRPSKPDCFVKQNCWFVLHVQLWIHYLLVYKYILIISWDWFIAQIENKFKTSEINYNLFVKRFGLVSQKFVERLTVNHILRFPCQPDIGLGNFTFYILYTNALRGMHSWAWCVNNLSVKFFSILSSIRVRGRLRLGKSYKVFQAQPYQTFSK